ncbi:GHRHR protein, partial [Chloroceryle aenea]|nr:GHRHR protein [Chloroceryle aenea]
LYHCALYTLSLAVLVAGNVHPECDLVTELKKKEAECLEDSGERGNATPAGCKRTWDKLLCWPEADAGQTLALPCPNILFHFMKEPAGIVKRNCTKKGWSDPFPPYHVACQVEDEIPLEEQSYFSTIKIIYTVGYSVSITSLIIAVTVLIVFRRLRCPRNYIHVQLFFTFILKAIAIFIKDAVLFREEDIDHCSFSTATNDNSSSESECVITAEFQWTRFGLIGQTGQAWFLFNCLTGFPTLFTLIWILAKFYFEDTACWDINQDSPYWWLIKGPIIISVGVNFVLFINIIRILLKKLDPRQINFNNSSQYRRLSRSTLLLIPLFGTHYIVFNFLPEYTSLGIRLYLELCIGSFQGFIVAVLYCFLNQEVQTEIGRRWHGKRYGFMRVWRRTRWTVPSSSGVKMTTSVC